jgi:thioesterase domain-containing protein/acyl carrier protein
MPLMPNGKVDRQALPQPQADGAAETSVKPRDEFELQLAKIWEKVLVIKNIGIKDNFFDLGGHSLLIVQLFSRIQKIFDRDLPLNTLFQAPTIEQLAGILRQEDWSSPWSSLVSIQPGGSNPPFFCVHGCTGKVLHFYDLARLLGPEQPFSGLSALGLEKGQVPHTRFEDMAAHYIKEIQTFQFDGPYFIGGSGDGCGIVMEMAHQLASQGQNIGLIVLFSPTPLKPKISSTKHYIYRRSLRRFFFLLNNLLKKRPLIPAIINAFLNRVLWHWRIFHKYLPRHIFRWRRFIAAFRKAQFSYTPRAYQGPITCFLSEEFSINHKKLIPDWYKLDAGGIDIRFVPGTINTMWQEPHVQILAEQLKVCLEKAQKDNEKFIDT